MNLDHFFKINKLENLLDSRQLDVEIPSFEIYPAYLKKNSIYFLWLSGDDAHQSLALALRKGAYVVTSEIIYKNNQNPKIIYVKSVRQNLKQLAEYQREHFNGEVIAITGSVGKSSVKNMLSQVLAMKHMTISTLGNENAWLGIYCTLANIRSETKYVVLETGASCPRSLSVPIQVVKPTISVLLDVNYSHQEKYNSFKELLAEKASVIDALVENGKLFIAFNVAQKLNEQGYVFRKDISMTTIGDSDHPQIDYKILNIDIDKKKAITNIFSETAEQIILSQPDRANAINSVYTWAVLKSLGMSLHQFNALIPFYKPLPRRFERLRICNQKEVVFELIDDAYNSSPISVLSALQSLEKRQTRRKILVFGDMLELGESTQELHQAIFDDSTFDQFERIILVGSVSHLCQTRFKADHIQSIKEAYEVLKDYILNGDLILLKASNGMNFYQLRKLFESEAIHTSSLTQWNIEDEYPESI